MRAAPRGRCEPGGDAVLDRELVEHRSRWRCFAGLTGVRPAVGTPLTIRPRIGLRRLAAVGTRSLAARGFPSPGARRRGCARTGVVIRAGRGRARARACPYRWRWSLIARVSWANGVLPTVRDGPEGGCQNRRRILA